ncbi:porin family protein [Mucilaginibacter paludis]|uniref:Outer membrane protein beta-barrel domain-containing protein n=1 Tax=Mucilaginibacter paludis DSM 18603 TaxID=714943 RepID=H1YH77_9SPHI|nr:porin family protein [Mucilaginibacter paludis]EHQ24579.1 hypothetical protein Mucpa_0383 [Mucilaginibacter paludis DSM 18603]
MRKLCFSSVFIIFSFAIASAQKLQYGLKGGLGFASQSITNPDILSTNSLTTFGLSVTVDYPLKHEFYVQAGAGILGKGVKEYQNAQTNTITLTYLDVPLNLLRKFNLPTLGKIYVGAGPYLSVGLSGNNQIEGVNTTTGTAVRFGNSEDFKKLDYGANFTTGLELNNHLTFNMRYSLGLNNVASQFPIDPNTTSIKNRIFMIGLGFWL